VLRRAVPTAGKQSPRTSSSPVWAWDQRHLHDRHDASNITFGSVSVGRTSPSRPTPLLQRHPERHPHDRLAPSAVDGLHRSDGPRSLCPSPSDLMLVLGSRGSGSASASGEAAGDGWDGSSSQPHQLHRRRPDTIARAPLPGLAPGQARARVRCRLSGQSGRLWRTADLKNPKAEHWRSHVERSRLN